MKKIIFIIFITISKINAQPNLVPNPSFEDTLNCDDSNFYLEDLITHWRGGMGYYNTCRSNNFGIPNNITGFQYARIGNAYCGIYTYGKYTTPIRQYIQTKLKQTLQNDKKYKVSFFVSLGDTLNAYSNSIGAYFSTDSFFVSVDGFIPQTPQIQNNIHNDLSSKTNWTLVCDTFVATGNERYITIGNFYNDSISNPVFLDSICFQTVPFNCAAYYYIDDVSVELVDETGLSPTNLPYGEAFKLLPNPNNGVFEIACSNNNLLNVSIQNLAGQLVYNNTIQPQNMQAKIDDAFLTKGIYILKVNDENGMQFLKLVIE